MPISSRTAAVLGWIGVATFAICSIVAALAYHGTTGEAYSPLNHYVSELGARKTGGLGTLFDAGIVIGALCLLAFLVDVGRLIGGVRGTAISVIGVIAGIAGACVGIFPMDVRAVHVLVASTFFVSLAGSVALATLWIGGPRLPRTPLATLLGAVTALASVGYFVIYSVEGPGPGGAADPNAPRPAFALDTTVEWIALIGIMAWVTVVALTMWRTASEPGAATGAAVPSQTSASSRPAE
jgi:hypothetical membrane protein